MNSIRNRAAEIINTEIIYTRFKPQRRVKSVAAWAFIQLLSLSSVVGGSV